MKPLDRFLALALLSGCSSPAVPSGNQVVASATAAPPKQAIPSASAPAVVPVLASAAQPAVEPPAISAVEAEEALFPEGAPKGADCLPSQGIKGRIRCLIGVRYEGHEAEKQIALSLFDASGSVAGVEHAHLMDGGFRGTIRIVPELPVGRHEKHLRWIEAASNDFDTLFKELAARGDKPIQYRHRPIVWKFFRSVNRTTPSAYALDWTVAYNVSGSLHTSWDAVRETLFHEIFHLNDQARSRSPEQWSRRALGPIHDAILAKCGTRPACLAPYAPTETQVRGGTYYAFQPNNGDAVGEYAADLAARYYRESRAIIRGEKPAKPAFKCGPEENGRAWRILVDEFFGGVDLVPGC